MSYTEFSYGFMIPIVGNVSEIDRNGIAENYEEISEMLYAAGASIKINYEGTIIYNDMNPDSERGNLEGIHLSSPLDTKILFDMIAEANKFKIKVNVDQAKKYMSIWYNGTDSYMSNITLKEFLSGEVKG